MKSLFLSLTLAVAFLALSGPIYAAKSNSNPCHKYKKFPAKNAICNIGYAGGLAKGTALLIPKVNKYKDKNKILTKHLNACKKNNKKLSAMLSKKSKTKKALPRKTSKSLRNKRP